MHIRPADRIYRRDRCAVRRPAIEELQGGSTVAELIQLAGDFGGADQRDGDAHPDRGDNQRHVMLPVDVAAFRRAQLLRNDDLVQVARLRPTLDSGILVQGHVYSPRRSPGTRAFASPDVVHSVDQLGPTPNPLRADPHQTAPDRHVAVYSTDLGLRARGPGTAADPELMPRDRIAVFDLPGARPGNPAGDGSIALAGNAQRPSQVVPRRRPGQGPGGLSTRAGYARQ